MTRFAICEDMAELNHEMETLIEETCAEHNLPFTVSPYLSGEELLKEIHAGEIFDIYFLDIHLDSVDGIRLGKEIRASAFGEKAILYYVSAFPQQYMYDMFNLHIYNFINKPVNPAEFKRMLLESLSPRMQLCMQDINGMNRRFDYKSIVSIESRNKNIIISAYQKGNLKEFTFRKKLSDVLSVLPMNQFISPIEYFIHPMQSFIVNLHYVTAFEKKSLILLNDAARTINISRPKIADIANQIDSYTRATCTRLSVKK